MYHSGARAFARLCCRVETTNRIVDIGPKACCSSRVRYHIATGSTSFARFTTRRPLFGMMDLRLCERAAAAAAASHACNRAIVLYRRPAGALCGPTYRIAGVTIDLSTHQVIRPSDRSMIYVAARRCHLRRCSPPPARSSWNTIQ